MTERLARFPQHFHLHPRAELPAGIDETFLAQWSERACGLACLRTVLAYYGAEVPTQWELVKAALELDAFTSRGIVHAKFVALAEQHGLEGAAVGLSGFESVISILDADVPAIVSVSHMLPDDGSRGGHLVVVARSADVGRVRLADPSRWGARRGTIDVSRFSSFSGRAVVLWPPRDADKVRTVLKEAVETR